MDAHAKKLSFIYQGRQIWLAPFYDLMCTNIYEDLSQKLAMKIGGENRLEWIMDRHWKRFGEEIEISHPVLQKRLSEFCNKLLTIIDVIYSNFIDRHNQNNLVENIIIDIKKRANSTLKL